MKYLDCHVHMSKKLDDPEKMLAQLDEAVRPDLSFFLDRSDG